MRGMISNNYDPALGGPEYNVYVGRTEGRVLSPLGDAGYVQQGYGQVEPNHLSGQATKQIYAQLPAAQSINILENGQFAKYDMEAGFVNFTGDGEWLLVFNEVKVYKPGSADADFAMVRQNYRAGIFNAFGDRMERGARTPYYRNMVPRLMATAVGDHYTTNTVRATTLAVGDTLQVGADGYLVAGDTAGEMTWKVVKVYTMPDGQPGVKLQRVV